MRSLVTMAVLSTASRTGLSCIHRVSGRQGCACLVVDSSRVVGGGGGGGGGGDCGGGGGDGDGGGGVVYNTN